MCFTLKLLFSQKLSWFKIDLQDNQQNQVGPNQGYFPVEQQHVELQTCTLIIPSPLHWLIFYYTEKETNIRSINTN